MENNINDYIVISNNILDDGNVNDNLDNDNINDNLDNVNDNLDSDNMNDNLDNENLDNENLDNILTDLEENYQDQLNKFNIMLETSYIKFYGENIETPLKNVMELHILNI